MGGCVLYSDGNPDRISWVIVAGGRALRERRVQAEMYRGRVSRMQAKFIALHVGLFRGIGVFAIKNGDAVRMLLDDRTMLSHVESGRSGERFSDDRIRFIGMLARQRCLDVSLGYVSPARNAASELL